MTLRILELLPSPFDGTSFYRGRGPTALLEKQRRGEVSFLPVHPNTDLDWDNLLKADAVFMQRPVGNEHVNMAIRCHSMNIPLWVDYDDLLSEVPEDNATHALYEGFKNNLRPILNHATIITVSTEFLKEKLIEFAGNQIRAGVEVPFPGEKILVIPNALHPLFGDPKLPAVTDRATSDGILWRGSYLHERDLLGVTTGVVDAWKATKKPFTFLGYNPWFYKDAGMKLSWEPYLNIWHYFTTLNQRLWNVAFVALHDSAFNRSKSSIAWLEYTWAGCAVVAPDFPEWRRPGVLNYTSPAELCEMITLLSKDQRLREYNWNLSASYITENLLLDKVNQQRWGVVERLMR